MSDTYSVRSPDQTVQMNMTDAATPEPSGPRLSVCTVCPYCLSALSVPAACLELLSLVSAKGRLAPIQRRC